MPAKKVIRVRKWKVQVYQDHVAKPSIYNVYAVDALDARTIAFAMDGGFPKAQVDMEDGDIELVKTYTKILGKS